MMKITTIFIAFITIFQLQAQDYQAGLERAMSIFNEASYEAKLEYVLYPTHESSEVIERNYMHIKKQGDNYYIDQFGAKTIYNEEFVLLVYEEGKMMAIERRREGDQENQIDEETLAKFKEALEKVSKQIEVEVDTSRLRKKSGINMEFTNEGNKQIYAFNFENGEYEKTELHLTGDGSRVEKQVIYYRVPIEIDADNSSKVRMEVNFLKQESNPVFAESEFEVSKYISVGKDGSVKPMDRYKDFYLINRTEEIKYR